MYRWKIDSIPEFLGDGLEYAAEFVNKQPTNEVTLTVSSTAAPNPNLPAILRALADQLELDLDCLQGEADSLEAMLDEHDLARHMDRKHRYWQFGRDPLVEDALERGQLMGLYIRGREAEVTQIGRIYADESPLTELCAACEGVDEVSQEDAETWFRIEAGCEPTEENVSVFTYGVVGRFHNSPELEAISDGDAFSDLAG